MVIEALVDHLLTPIVGFLFDRINIAYLKSKFQSAIILSLLITIINKSLTTIDQQS
jgi:large-conductance mechanosensitive channel